MMLTASLTINNLIFNLNLNFMANVMSLKKLTNKPSRNGFDLSKRNIFSAKVGELLPVYCKEVIPGDKFKINVKSFTRTMPVNTAAYTRIKEYYDWFFVPTNLLWNKFNSFITQMTDNVQHAQSWSETQQIDDTHPYFTLENLFDYYYQINNAYNASTDSAEHKAATNLFGFNRGPLTAKLLDYLGYSNFRRNTMTTTGNFAENVALNPFPLLAYQKIYSDYFRDSQWEKVHAPSFNVDYLYGGQYEIDVPQILARALTTNQENMFDLRYCNWNKDLFMGVKPNSQFGDAASVDLSSLLQPTTLTDFKLSYSAASSSNVELFDGNLHVSGQPNGSQWFLRSDIVSNIASAIGLTTDNLQSAFTILALRQAEALQKWKEITLSQQQDYKAQIEAHFGVSVSDAYSERCKYIDGFSNVIDINEVVNTNLIPNSNNTSYAADIAGRGVGVQDGQTNFSSDVHGYLMCIYHAVPLLDYALESRLSKQITKTNVIDYAIPELDKTGMVQVPMIEMTNDIELNDGQLLGYAPRYYDYKTDVDEVHGSALNQNSAWVAPFNDQYLKTLLYRGDLLNEQQPISWQFFKVNPAVLDPIFAAQVQVDATTNSDQLLTNCSFQINCVRNLDYDGLPY